MKYLLFALFAAILLLSIESKIFFHERFNEFPGQWKQSTAATGKTLGKFELSSGDYGVNQGLKTTEDYRHYVIAKEFDEAFTNDKKPFVLQYTVKNTQNLDCGGTYLKIGMKDGMSDMSQMKDDTQYAIMFGPDVCGSTKKVHAIFQYKGKNLDWKKQLRPPTDQLTHIFTFIVNPDGTYEVQIDGQKKESGKLEEDWDFLPPQQIPDPDEKKPEDWVDEAKIADPEDKKPEDWDDEPKFIPDPEAEKPEDWDEEEDGEFEPAQIANPKYKGEWSPRMIDNPEYKGVWEAQLIDNPEYEADDTLGQYQNINWVAIEVWQVKAGSIFDSILITDSVDDAKAEADRIQGEMKEEKANFDAAEAEKKAKEEEAAKKKAEEEEAKKAEEAEKEEAQKEAEAQEEQEADEHDEL